MSWFRDRAAFSLLRRCSLAGCGFQLRGTATVPFKTLYRAERRPAASRSTSSATSRPAPTRSVVDDAAKADAIAAVHRGGAARRKSCRSPAPAACASSSCAIASASACTTARARDFVPPSEILLTRDVTFNDPRSSPRSRRSSSLPRHADRHGAADPAPPGRREAGAKPAAPVAVRASLRAARGAPREEARAALRDPRRRAAARARSGRRMRAAARARRASPSARCYEPGRCFDWSELAHAGASLSLFGGKKIVELRLTGGKPERAGGAGASSPGASARSRGAAARSPCRARKAAAGRMRRWFVALDKAGVVVEVLQVARGAPARLAAERLALQKQSAPAEVLEFSPTASKATCSPRTRKCRSSRCCCARGRAFASRRCAKRCRRRALRRQRRGRSAARGRHRALPAHARRPARRRRGADRIVLFTISECAVRAVARRADGSSKRAADARIALGARRYQPAEALAARDLRTPRADRPRDQGRRQGRRAVGGVRQARPRAACRGTRPPSH